MSTATTRDHLAELIELKEACSEILIETRHAASIHHAYVRAADAQDEFAPFINECGIKTAESTTGTKPCK